MWELSLLQSIPISIVFGGTAAGTFGAHGTLPTLLAIWSKTLVSIDANPFLLRVVVRVTWVTLGFYCLSDHLLTVL